MDEQKITIRGTVTRDPDLSTTAKGKVYTRVSVAADEVTIAGQKRKPEEHKYQSLVFWGVEAVDKVKELKRGAQVAVTGNHVVRQVEGREGQMRVFSEIHRGTVSIEKQPRERMQGAPTELKGGVLYDPELRAVPGSTGKFYTVVTIQPDNGGDKVRAAFFGEEALDFARSVRRGSQVLVKGELVEREYTSREGIPSKGLEIQKAELRVLDEGRAMAPRAADVARQHEDGVGR